MSANHTLWLIVSISIFFFLAQSKKASPLYWSILIHVKFLNQCDLGLLFSSLLIFKNFGSTVV
jgi:hypothetical protein